MLIKWDITIPELSGDTPRRAFVWLPEQCREDPEARFPVLYMFDGHNLFSDQDATYGRSWRLGEFLEREDLPLIVAAVDCDPGEQGERLSEYSPFDFNFRRGTPIKGRGQETMRWYIEQFKPLVDREFPTLPDREHTFIGGSSMGGLMSLYAVTRFNEVFSGAAALSPSIWVAPQELDALLRSCPLAPGTRIYMDCGEKELSYRRGAMRRRLGQVARILLDQGALLTFRLIPGGQHNEASWEAQVPWFVGTLMYGE